MTGHRSLGAGSGWGPALRVARRELLRAKGRTLLVLLMVLLPVTAVVCADTLLRTGERTAVESLDRDLGAAQARVEAVSTGRVTQSPDLRRNGGYDAGGPARLTAEQVAAALPPGTRLLAVHEPFAYDARPVRTADGRIARVGLTGVDLRDPQVRGPWTVLRGRAPSTANEVAVTPALERFGFPAGSVLRLPDGGERTVVGTVLYPLNSNRLGVVGLPEAVGLADVRPRVYYAHGPEVSWDDLRELNALGALVLSRSVVTDPPPDSEVPPVPGSGRVDGTTVALVGLVVVIAVLEVVLLAGPAFAVGARRQRRALALMAAGGAEPRHVRRVVLAQGLLVGVTAAVLSAGLGTGLAALLRAPITRFTGTAWGPFEVNARDVVLFCLLGAVTAVLAALVPALVAARQPVVASLQGRRTPQVRALAPSVAGVALLALGVASCAWSIGQYQAELLVAFSAVPTVLGAALLAPLVLAGVGRLAGRLPLALRFAVRDADRQRGRTAPAVAAITATVAGVVALGVSLASDAQERQAQYTPSGPPGAAVVTTYGPESDPGLLERAAESALPGARVLRVPGIAAPGPSGPGEPYEQVLVCRPGQPAAVSCNGFADQYGGWLGSSVLVGPAGLEAVAPLLAPGSLAAARDALEDGAAVVAGAQEGSRVELRRQLVRDGFVGQRTAESLGQVTVPAVPMVTEGTAPAQAVVSEEVAARLGGTAVVALVVGEDVTRAEQERLQDAVQRVDTGAYVTVERGPVDEGTDLALLLLGGAAAFVLLGGTLAASSLALTEARPDLATLGSVGARPRTRRTVAAAYAYVLALAGALLGCLAGLVPGVAGGVAITRQGAYASSSGLPGVQQLPGRLDHLDVPWLLLLALVVVLPLVAAAVAGLCTRSRLPAPGRRLAA